MTDDRRPPGERGAEPASPTRPGQATGPAKATAPAKATGPAHATSATAKPVPDASDALDRAPPHWLAPLQSWGLPLAGLGIGLLMLAVSYLRGLNQEAVGVGVIAGSLLAWGLQPGKGPTKKAPAGEGRWSLPLMAFGVLLAATSLWFARMELYHRSLWFFACWAAGAALVAAGAAISTPRQRGFAWFSIAALSTIFALTVYTQYQGFYGADPWFHADYAQTIHDDGSIEGGQRYQDLPHMHLLVATTMFLTGLSLEPAYFVISLVLASTIPMSYLLMVRHFGHRVAILGAFLFATTSFFLYWSFWLAGTTYGFAFVAAILYTWFRAQRDWDAANMTLVIIFGLAVQFSHSLSALMALFFAAALAITARGLATRDPAGRWARLRGNAGVLMALVVLTMTKWMYSFYTGQTFFEFFVGTSKRILVADFEGAEQVSRTFELNRGVTFLDNIGYAFFLALFVAGALWALRGYLRGPKIPYVVAGVAAFAIIYGGALAGINAILPHRWFLVAFFFAAPFAALTLLKLFSGRRPAQTVLLVAVVGGLVFASGINSWANSDSSPYDIPRVDRTGYLDSELASLEFVAQHADLPALSADNRFDDTFVFGDNNLTAKFSTDRYGTLFIRRALVDSGRLVPIAGGYYVSEHVDFNAGRFDAVSAVLPTIYSSGEMLVMQL